MDPLTPMRPPPDLAAQLTRQHSTLLHIENACRHELLPAIENLQQRLGHLEELQVCTPQSAGMRCAAVACSAAEIDAALLTLGSLLRCTPHSAPAWQLLLIVDGSISDDLRSRIKEFAACHAEARLELPDAPAPQLHSCRPAALARCLSGLVQLREYQRLLYLQPGMLCNADPGALWELPLGGCLAAAVLEECPESAALHPAPGLLLINLELLRKHPPAEGEEGERQLSAALRPLPSVFNVTPAAVLADDPAIFYRDAVSLARPPAAQPQSVPGPAALHTHRWRARRAAHAQLLLSCGTAGRRAALSLLGHEVVVSMTTIPQRAAQIGAVLEALLSQSFAHFQLVLWLGEELFHGQVPAELAELAELSRGRLEIRSCRDVRSYTKLLPALQAFPEALIVTADDDMIYPRSWLLELLLSYLEDRHSIHCHQPRRCLIDQRSRQPRPYAAWPPVHSDQPPACSLMTRGAGGVLYPPHSLPPAASDAAAALRICPTQDDLWLWAQAVAHGTAIRRVPESSNTRIKELHYFPPRELYAINQRENDPAVQRLWQMLEGFRDRVLRENPW